MWAQQAGGWTDSSKYMGGVGIGVGVYKGQKKYNEVDRYSVIWGRAQKRVKVIRYI